MPDDGLPNHTQRLSLPGLSALVLQCLNQDRVVQVIDWHLVPLHFRGKRGGFDTEFFGLRRRSVPCPAGVPSERQGGLVRR
jgi:hypothetical protein